MSDDIDSGCLLPAPNSKDLHCHNQVNIHILMNETCHKYLGFFIMLLTLEKFWMEEIWLKIFKINKENFCESTRPVPNEPNFLHKAELIN